MLWPWLQQQIPFPWICTKQCLQENGLPGLTCSVKTTVPYLTFCPLLSSSHFLSVNQTAVCDPFSWCSTPHQSSGLVSKHPLIFIHICNICMHIHNLCGFHSWEPVLCFKPSGFQGLISSFQAWHQAHIPGKPSHQSSTNILHSFKVKSHLF